MEAVREAIAQVGTKWSPDVHHQMEELHEPLHAAQATKNAETISATKALKYGPNDRHRIDVYSPKERSGLLPVVVYFHGGAFVVGDNDISSHLHGNIATYFANNGCIGCLATYRLVPEAKFPNGPDDVAAALGWVQQNIASHGGDPARVLVIGQSAGGAHLASSLFLGRLNGVDGGPPLLKTAVILSASLTFNLALERRRMATESYFDTKDHAEILDKSSVGLFRKMETELPCEVFLFLAEYDFDEIVDANLALVAEWRKKYGRLPTMQVIKGHNHISDVFGIGLPDNSLGPIILELIQSSQS